MAGTCQEYSFSFLPVVSDHWQVSNSRGGGVLTLTSYTYMCLPFGAIFREIWYSDRGVSSETKEPKLHKLGVFWANCCKKHPIWSKLGDFLSKMVYWWVGNLAKYWYRDSQIFKVRQAHPRTILVKGPPPPGFKLHGGKKKDRNTCPCHRLPYTG